MSKIITLKNENLQVDVSPKIGGSIAALKYNLNNEWINIMRPTPTKALEQNDPGDFSSFTMMPYSNRIENGVLKVNGKTYQLEINNGDGHRIHGDVRENPWKITKQSDTELVIEFNSNEHSNVSWPFPYSAVMEYVLSDNSFVTKMTIKNESSEVMPAGMGIHPYFVRHLTASDTKVLAEIPVKGIYPGDTPIPTGRWVKAPESIDFSAEKELPTDFLDKCYRADENKVMRLTWPDSGVMLTLENDEVFKNVIIFCPKGDSRYFAVEPVTNCNNGFNMAAEGIEDTGTQYLDPGKELKGKINISIDTTF